MKTGIKTLMVLALSICCLNFAGCIWFPKNYNTNATPVYPELGDSGYPVIDTLQPELRWKDVKSEGQTYDVGVWEASSRGEYKSLWGLPVGPGDWGEHVSYVQGISENRYKIAKPLKPNTTYHWSVRIRKGDNVSEWGSFSQTAVGPLVVGHKHDIPYGFVTPEK
jgi:hypothetical protein